MLIKAVFFDMGGTIETYNYTYELRLQAVPGLQERLASAGIGIHLEDRALLDVISKGLSSYHQWRMQSLQELSGAQIWREYILAGYPMDFNALDAIAEDLMFYIETCFYRRVMRPEIPAVLEAVRRMGLKIGLISNVSSRGMVPAKLREYGIDGYFDPVVLSSVYGRRKPDPSIFHYAARLANTPASQCIYVGDRIARDIVGARRAGYAMAIQIQHDFDHGEDDEGATPDALIHQMTELLDVLQAETGSQANDDATALSPPEKIRAFLFDAGDILYFRPERGSKFGSFLQELSLGPGENHMAQKQALSNLAYQGQITLAEYREELVRLCGVTMPEQIEHGMRLLEEEDNDVHFFDGVARTLAALKQRGFLLGIITDTANPVHVKLNWFERGGFGDVWDTIISSQEMGVRKPNPEIYHAALQQLGLLAQDTVFVGHKALELEGARVVGMKTVAFNYDEAAQADFYINNFGELLETPFAG